MVFQPPFALNIDYGGNFKGGVTPSIGVGRGCSPLPPTQFGDSVVPPTQSDRSSWCQRAVGLFVCPSCSQMRENTAFELVLQSTWRLSSPGKDVARSSTPCWKRSQVWGT